MQLLVQLSDPHVVAPGERLFGRIDTAAMLRMALTSVARLAPQPIALIITGDLVANGQAAEYRALADILQAGWRGPLYLLPGNHDDRDALRREFANHVWLGRQGPIHYAVDVGSRRLFVLDTLVPGAEAGELDDAQLAWLAGELEACPPQRPVWIALHHPPFLTEMPALDAIGLRRGRHEFERLLASHGQIERVISGHVHRAIDRVSAGVLHSTAPSTAHQIMLDFAQPEAMHWNLEPAGYRVHVLPQGRGAVTYTVPSAQYAGPYPYD